MLSHLAPDSHPSLLCTGISTQLPCKPGALESLQSIPPKALDGYGDVRTEGKLCRRNLRAATPHSPPD